ncbi:MAG TPA: flagellar export chaperone FliS [Bryobacteraceae bacterium]|nr:flagellar export chaperone FliS [Bryobacteraceae bacterium]
MRRNSLDSYRENRILTANSVTLGHILLEETLRATRLAQAHAAPEEAFERGRHASKAMNILTEFMLLLESDECPELAASLKRICEYAHYRLMSAHAQGAGEGFQEVLRLLQPILEAWTTVEKREAQERRNGAAGGDVQDTVAPA